MRQYKNRYGDVFTFTEDDHQDILWEGDFKYCRFGMPNDYSMAYAEYLREGGDMELEEFKTEVHKYDDKTCQYIYDKYNSMVVSLTNEIEMVDPSGGPYISRGMSLDSFGFKDYVVKDFKRIDTGYKIITEKCTYCNLAGVKHKISCSTQKATVLMSEKENSPLIEIDRFTISGDPGFTIPLKDENSSIVDWILFDSKDEVQAHYDQIKKTKQVKYGAT